LFKPTKNTFILSKGHSSAALLSVVNLINNNKFKKYLENFNLNGSYSGNNCSENVPGFEFHTGSLGHGVGLACGVALAKKNSKIKGNTIVLISDGELHEGSIFEGILFGDQHNLNVVVIIDNNKQICEDYTKNVVGTEKFLSFLKKNFNTLEINGHNYKELSKINSFIRYRGFKIIIANTIKGKGVKFMENVIRWHHSIPNQMEFEKALKELS
jgi:transketolase